MVKPAVHLFRGAPAVRSWSKYRQTIEQWTLCGIARYKGRKPRQDAAHCTEDASLVSCHYCLVLMRPTTKKATGTAK